MATKKYSHLQVILYAVGLWAVSFPIFAFWMSSSIGDSTGSASKAEDGKASPAKKAGDGSLSADEDDDDAKPVAVVDKMEELKKKKAEDFKKNLRAERKASLSLSHMGHSGEAEQIEWQWISKAQMIQLIHELQDQSREFFEKVEKLKNQVCYDKSTELKFDPTYKKIDELMEKEAFTKHGISSAQWRKLIKFHLKDPMIKKEFRPVQQQARENEESMKNINNPKLKEMDFKKFMDLNKEILEETKTITLQLRWTDEREDMYDVQPTQLTIQFMVSSRMYKKYDLSEKDIAEATWKFEKDIRMSKEYAQQVAELAHAQYEMREAADPDNWKEKEGKEAKESADVDDTFIPQDVKENNPELAAQLQER